MILVDDPAGFPRDLVASVEPSAAVPDGPAGLWRALAPGRAPRVVRGLDVPASWRHGFLVASPSGSQFDALRAATAAAPLAAPVWALAGAGAGCRGQHGRPWRALAGNLHLSAAWPAPADVARHGPVLTALAAVAVADAVARLAPAAPRGIKWVNDVWLGGAKVAGVLTALRARPPRGEVFVGVGLNVAAAPDLPGDRFTPRTTCLDAWAPGPCGLAVVLGAVLAALTRRWSEFLEEGSGTLLAAYRGLDLARGRPVAVWPDDAAADAPLARGRGGGVSDDLGLLLEGRPEPLREGRLELGEA